MSRLLIKHAHEMDDANRLNQRAAELAITALLNAHSAKAQLWIIPWSAPFVIGNCRGGGDYRRSRNAARLRASLFSKRG